MENKKYQKIEFNWIRTNFIKNQLVGRVKINHNLWLLSSKNWDKMWMTTRITKSINDITMEQNTIFLQKIIIIFFRSSFLICNLDEK